METASSDLAFPVFDSTGRYNPGSCGLTKREYFAAIAMQSLINFDPTVEFAELASDAVRCADALIAALNKELPD